MVYQIPENNIRSFENTPKIFIYPSFLFDGLNTKNLFLEYSNADRFTMRLVSEYYGNDRYHSELFMRFLFDYLYLKYIDLSDYSKNSIDKCHIVLSDITSRFFVLLQLKEDNLLKPIEFRFRFNFTHFEGIYSGCSDIELAKKYMKRKEGTPNYLNYDSKIHTYVRSDLDSIDVFTSAPLKYFTQEELLIKELRLFEMYI